MMFQGFRYSASSKKASRRRRLSDSRRKAAMAPLMEALEDRTVMSTLVWTGGNGDWDNAAKWGGTIPGASDTALINDSNITITHNTGAADSVGDIQFAGSGSTLNLSGGSLTVTGNTGSGSSLNNFTLSSGTFTYNASLAASMGSLTQAGG